MRERPLATLAFLALVPVALCAQSRADRAEALVRAYIVERSVPGVGVAVADEGEVVFTVALGHADLEAEAPVTTQTLFRTASVLKPMTATAVWALASDGLLDLDAPIQTYCPAYPEKRWPVTARRLIDHEAGVRPSVFADIFNRQHYPTVNDALARFAGDTLVAEPGTRAAYSNAGYTLLACAIEGAAGTSYDLVMRERVFGPAEMTHTRVDNVFEVIPGRARPYMVRTEDNTEAWEGLWQRRHLASTVVDEPFNADPVDPSWSPGAGGYLTTPTDLVRFAWALMGGNLLPSEVVDSIPSRHRLADGALSDRSHGWILEDTGSGMVMQVLGSDWNGSSGLWVTADGFAIAVSTNKAFEQPAALIESLARLWGRLPAN